MKKVALLATGGTISTAKDVSGVIPTLGATQLLDGINGYLSNIEVVPIDVSKMSSRNVTPGDIWRLSHAVERCIELGYDGVVITHGTDTLEETVYGLSVLLQRTIPVIMTGAMISPSRPGADGVSNLIDAVIAASDFRLATFGPLLSFQNELFAARYATKKSSTRTDAFDAPFMGAIGRVVEDKVELFVTKLNFDDYLGESPEPTLRIEIVSSYTGADGLLVDLLAPEVDGLIVAGTGGGHTSAAMAESLIRLAATGKPVILASRTFDGLVLENTYGGVGSEIHLLNNGLLSARDLSPYKARLRLLFGMQSGRLPAEIFS
ncbi:MAG: asparaginase [Microbacteriaceae bacterium]